MPACPAWTIRDLLAHVTGVAADAVGGTYFPDAAQAWRDPGLAAARDAWTAAQVRSRRDRAVAALAAGPFEMLRALSGRRTLEQVRALGWDGDPEPYLDLISPYPVPAAPLAE